MITQEETTETINKIKTRIPQEAQKILEIYIEETRPPEYLKKYGTSNPKINHMSEYLKISPKEVKRLKNIIKIQCMITNLGF